MTKMYKNYERSPSTRRAWIEIVSGCLSAVPVFVALHPEGVDRNGVSVCTAVTGAESPSTRRAWIEMSQPSNS